MCKHGRVEDTYHQESFMQVQLRFFFFRTHSGNVSGADALSKDGGPDLVWM